MASSTWLLALVFAGLFSFRACTAAQPPCSILCGVRRSPPSNSPNRVPPQHLINFTRLTLRGNFARHTRYCEDYRVLWASHATDFLTALNMTIFRNQTCSTEESTNLPRSIQNTKVLAEYSIGYPSMTSYARLENSADTECSIYTVRGIAVQMDFDTKWYLILPAQSHTSPEAINITRSTINLQLFDVQKNELHPVPLPSNKSDNCSITSSCSLFYEFSFKSDIAPRLRESGTNSEIVFPSFFARDGDSYQRGAALMRRHLDRLESASESANEDVSLSNLAILMLPVLMSLPPISFFEVSTYIVIWYALATDVVATLPLLIKGIELIVVERNNKSPLFIDTRRTQSTFGSTDTAIFETWMVHCETRQGWKGSGYSLQGIIFVCLASWLMVASIFAEFLIWRSRRRKRLPILSQYTFGLSDDDPKIAPGYFVTAQKQSCSARTGNFICRHFWHDGKKWKTIFAGLWLLFGPIAGLAQIFGLGYWKGGVFLAFGLITAVLSCILHMLCSTSVSFEFNSGSFPFFTGFILGLISGPIYVIATIIPALRVSEKWHLLTKGANLGLSCCVLIWLYVLEGFGGIVRFSNGYPFLSELRSYPVWQIGCSLYIVGCTIIHCIRSSSTDRRNWRLPLLSFFTGIVFGPFFFLFRHSFPEVSGEPKMENRVKYAAWIGVVLLTAFSTSALTFVVQPGVL